MKKGRRQFLKGAVAMAAAAGVAGTRRRQALAETEGNERFLIILCGLGGYSIQDAFMAVRVSEAASPAELNCFPDEFIEEIGPFRAVSMAPGTEGASGYPSFQAEFLRRHASETTVWTQRASSVNHLNAQTRCLNGDAAWAGRTLMEAVAAERGRGLALPNVNMAGSGFAVPGTDPSIPAYARPIGITDPRLFALGTHAYEGLRPTWTPQEVSWSRRFRTQVEAGRDFNRRHRNSRRLETWLEARSRALDFEAQSLISKLSVVGESESWPLTEYGIDPSADLAALEAAFPKLEQDPTEAQAALAFLLVKHRASSVVTIAPPAQGLRGPDGEIVIFNSVFDAAHNIHRPSQDFHWSRLLEVADGLIGLLKSTPYGDQGESLWDRTVLYMPSEFGRVQVRYGPGGNFGTAHDFPGVQIAVSPLIRGGRIFGDIERSQGRLIGFEPTASNAIDPTRPGISEKEGFSAMLELMGISRAGSGLPPADFLSKA
ncbi:MAG: hypothetical protein AAGD10_04925 [Myxococcota bacterium]